MENIPPTPTFKVPEPVFPDQTIVIALDASEQAEYAINWYIQRAHRPGNRLLFIHCIELPEMKISEQTITAGGAVRYNVAPACASGGAVALPRPGAVNLSSPSAGSLHMSPGVLASLWREEEQKVK